MIKNVCVYCGSKVGNNNIYLESAILLGESLAKAGLNLVYGGAKIGLMGALASAVLKGGAKVTGILPHFLAAHKEVAHENLTQLILVDSMHERKQKMFEMSDAFVILPGGLGTLEEFAEMMTWFQLGAHNKPLCLLNIDKFYDPLLKLFDNMQEEGFTHQASFAALLVVKNPNECVEQLLAYLPLPASKKWDLDYV